MASSSSNRKRSLSSEDPPSPSTSKRTKLSSNKSLLSLSDDVLLEIFSHLTTPDLVQILSVCQRLSKVAMDKSLWRKVDTSSSPLSVVEFRKLLKFLHTKTTSITIGGFLGRHHQTNQESVTPAILETICRKCPRVDSFELVHCFVDASKVKVSSFPTSIRHFGIINCELINLPTSESYFKTMHTIFPDLESLDLSNSAWLPNHSLQAICKCDNLSKVNLQGCRRMGECFVYTALATRFGFRQTKWMDLRNTCFGDSEVACFSRLPEIRTLLMGHTSNEPVVPPSADSEGRGVITDVGVSAMFPTAGDPHVMKLERLTLTCTDITEKSVDRLLRSMPSLKSLDICGCSKIAADRVEGLLGLRPSCTVIYDQPEV